MPKYFNAKMKKMLNYLQDSWKKYTISLNLTIWKRALGALIDMLLPVSLHVFHTLNVKC